MSLTKLFELEAPLKEDIAQVLKILTAEPCQDCRIGLRWPNNRGLVYRGNPRARMAALSEAPGGSEMEMGQAMVGKAGQLLDTWFSYLSMNPNQEAFIINIVQCQPPLVKKEGRMQQRPPEKDEIATCFPARALRVLRAMPNLEVVWTLGWAAARALLGGEPGVKTHEGSWFLTDLLPGVPVYCMVHPSYLLREPGEEKEGRVLECLDGLRRLYLDTGKVVRLARETQK